MHLLLCHIHIAHSVIKEIVNFLNSGAKDIVVVVPFEIKFPLISNKIRVNFIKKRYNEVRNIFFNNWDNIEYVEYFIKENLNKYEDQFYIIITSIRNHFRKVPCNNKYKVDFPVNDPLYFDKLSRFILPKNRKNDPRYLLAATAIVLCLFQHGEFCLKTPNDPHSFISGITK